MFTRASLLLLGACLVAGASRASENPFVGQWKLVKLTDEMKVTNIGANKYAFDFGGGVETIVVDGTDQPGIGGTMLSVAEDGPNWRVVRKQSGRALLTASWTLSTDGNTLRDHFTAFGPNGSPSTVDYAYARRAAGSGFAGTWVGSITPLDAVILLQVGPYASDGLSFIIPSRGDTTNVHFDGKVYPDASAPSASSARRLTARAVEITYRSKGAITKTRQFSLSPDLKTLTMTVHLAGEKEARVYVFERQ